MPEYISYSCRCDNFCCEPRCYCCPVWIKGPTGPAGPVGATGATGPIGPTGPEGPLTPQSFVQLYDRNYTNDLTQLNTNLDLSNVGINPIFSTGGYTLTTTTVNNDTLNFLEAGLYHIEIFLNVSFLLPRTPPPFGSTFQILFNILSKTNRTLGSLNYFGIIPNDPNAIIETTLSKAFLFNASAGSGIKIALSNFNFDLAFEKKLSVYDIIIIVQKWEKP
ncbi:collagen-like triple helix repeat-containing protein [Oceanirhabdus sp. W0125-5]|uniref:collagen-like triple helix repeat-containing protein n=1 Tax=Oceanirhabdus sp. W0125-5 TaxID=2999116 RepID=UPI0022F33919|nr:collagen-like protein [Oceanirhabdus sp. W0125-5]WBW98985.1 collagen-like protein [Oceanirhabdus sp. W0125-5]